MLQSLEKQAGLPLSLDPATNTIAWPDAVRVEKTSVRSLAEMRAFLSNFRTSAPTDTIYTMYRNVCLAADEAAIRSLDLRYDITVIPPGAFDGKRRRELFRTAGHYHPFKPGTGVAYPEIYEVLSGHAYWLIQRPKISDPAIVEEVYLIEAGPGEKAIMLPGFGHVTINAYQEPLVLSDWTSTAFTSDYEPYRRMHGAAYWAFEGPNPETIVFDVNTHYRNVPDLAKYRPREIPEFGLTFDTPAYELVRDLEKLRFLSDPEDFTALLTLNRCYEKVASGGD
ncbi:glucose-6-phosphate isomerase [Candidatus Parcubacteria bacterium]|nr:MAG: glucose-6-phosphate isomerase [Candidatus Parcubacteria bacterium]